MAAADSALAWTAMPAHAAAVDVTDGRAHVTFTKRSARALAVSASSPARRSGRSTVVLPISVGRFDFARNRGTLRHRGTLTLRAGRRTVGVRSLRFRLARSSRLTGVVGGRRVAVFAVSRRAARQRDAGAVRQVRRLKLRFTRRGAALVNRGLRRTVARPGRTVATARVALRRAAALPPAGGGATGGGGPGGGSAAAPTVPATAGLALAPAFRDALARGSLVPAAVAPAVQGADGSVTLPVASGRLEDGGALAGTVDLQGGVRFGNGVADVALDDPRLVLGGPDQGLFAGLAGTRVKVADVDATGVIDRLLEDGSRQLSNLDLTLTGAAAPLLNTLTGTTVFVPGTPLGDLSLELPRAG
jgi:hypothetical protein